MVLSNELALALSLQERGDFPAEIGTKLNLVRAFPNFFQTQKPKSRFD